MDGLIVIIALLFRAAGLGYGRGASRLTTGTDVIKASTESWAVMAGLLLFLLIAEFIAYFNYSTIPQIAAVRLSDLWTTTSSIGDLCLLLGAVATTLVVGIIMPQAIAKCALLAPMLPKSAPMPALRASPRKGTKQSRPKSRPPKAPPRAPAATGSWPCLMCGWTSR